MSALAPLVSRNRRILALPVTIFFVVMAIVMLSLSVVPDAHAEAGRRICVYSFAAHPDNYPEPKTKISLGLDYEKSGKCPPLDRQKIANTGYVNYADVFFNPVKKETCEKWGTSLFLAQTDLGDDPCPRMLNDHLYAFFNQDDTTLNAKKPRYKDLGHWTEKFKSA